MFAHLMARAGLFVLDNQVSRNLIKVAGDAFEAIVGLYHRENGRDLFYTWVHSMFPPLVAVAGRACQ